jgi:hypothetical protein
MDVSDSGVFGTALSAPAANQGFASAVSDSGLFGTPLSKPAAQGFTFHLSERSTDSGFGSTLCMDSYSARLETFKTYPVKPFHPRPSELAALGFYYLGLDDKVKCFSCNLRLHHWEQSDLVLNEHYRWSLGDCRFMNHINNFRP